MRSLRLKLIITFLIISVAAKLPHERKESRQTTIRKFSMRQRVLRSV